MKKFIFVLFLLLAFSAIILIGNPFTSTSAPPEDTAGKPPGDEPGDIPDEPVFTEAKILAVGDIIVHEIQLRQAYDTQTGGYDFGPSFEYISKYIKEADLALGNLETTFGGQENLRYAGYPLFNSPDELAVNLKEAGFDLLATANNHSLDTGERGLYRTIEIIEKAGLKSFGTARTLEERNTPLVVEVNGINIALLAYTDSTNGIPIPAGKDYIINFANKHSEAGFDRFREEISTDIKRARVHGADIVAVYMHWGYPEYIFNPDPNQQRMARIVAEAGGDIIFGAHVHVIQPMEYLTVTGEDGSVRETLVVYSMGNFMSNQHFSRHFNIPTEEVEYGLAPRVYIKKNMTTGETFIEKVDYLITWCQRRVTNDDWHRVLPLHEVLNSPPEAFKVSAQDYTRVRQGWEKTVDRLKGFRPAFNVN